MTEQLKDKKTGRGKKIMKWILIVLVSLVIIVFAADKITGLKFFKVKELDNNVYQITADYVNSYLIVGDNHALVFDTGYGYANLKEKVREITNLPLYVVDSHGHIDHSAGNGDFFEPIYMNHEDLEVYERHNSKELRAQMYDMMDGMQKIPLIHTIPSNMSKEDFVNASTTQEFIDIREGYVFELGGLTLEVYEIPGHTKGSVGLLCKEKRLFFSSDGICDNTWLYLPESTTLSVYCESIKKIQQLDFDYYYTGHETQAFTKEHLADCLDVAENIDYENGKVGEPSIFAPGVEYRTCRSKNKDNKVTLTISIDKIDIP